jgi:outer membrane receptor protein involved in Fe transport
VSCDPVLPRWSFNSRFGFGYDKFDASVFWQYMSAVNYEPRSVAGVVVPIDQTVVGSFGSTDPNRIVGAYRRISPYHWFDLNLGADVTDNLRLSLLVQNLFDRKAPDVGNTIGTTAQNSGNTYPSIYDALGRRYTLTAGVRF